MTNAPISRLPKSQPQRQRPGMVRWYDYQELMRTGIQEFLSTTMGSLMDARRSMPRPGESSVFDYSEVGNGDHDGAFWFDYMADTGDGWIATYTMAQLLSQTKLTVTLPDGQAEQLSRGRLLILGGDEVYPVASEVEYEQRLLWPLDEAAGNDRDRVSSGEVSDTPPEPHVFMIPGNHDWYDNLESFTKFFCADPRRIGVWHTRQKQSYFALQLPYGWHLWGLDVALRGDIDNNQLKFFLAQADQLETGSRVILCSAVPEWVDGRPSSDTAYRLALQHLVAAVEKQQGGPDQDAGQVPVFLAGDIHNYQRYTGDSGGKKTYRQTKVVSGGGGAFLHPTHAFGEPDPQEPQRFTCQNRYPDEQTSQRLALANLIFPLTNWKLSVVLGVTYFLMFAKWSRDFSLTDLIPWVSLPQSPFIVALVALFAFALVKFAGIGGLTGAKRWVWGGLHALAHITLAAGICLAATKVQSTASYALYARGEGKPISAAQWRALAESSPDEAQASTNGSAQLQARELPPRGPELRDYIAKYSLPWVGWINPLIVIVLGGIFGGFLFGGYLLLSLNWLKVHRNEAFCSLRVADYKHFLRFKLTRDELRMYVIKVEKMPTDTQQHRSSNVAIHDCLESVQVWP